MTRPAPTRATRCGFGRCSHDRLAGREVVADADAEEEEVLGEGRLPHSRNERIQTHRHTNAQTTKQTTRLLLARLSHRSHCCSHQPHRLLTSLALPLPASLAIAAACQAGGAGAGCAVTTQHVRRVRAGDAASRPHARGQGPIRRSTRWQERSAVSHVCHENSEKWAAARARRRGLSARAQGGTLPHFFRGRIRSVELCAV